MQLSRGIHEAVRDKAADELYAHLLALGIQAEILRGHPVKKVGTSRGKSLGLVQVAGRNIGYVNVIRGSEGSSEHRHTEYYLEYLVPLRDIPSSLCWATLGPRSRSLLSRQVVDIEWIGGDTLADTLNGDLALKQSLLMEFRVNRSLEIQVARARAYQCVRIVTGGVTQQSWLRRPALHLPSGSLFDCLDRIAGHVIENNARPEKVLLEVKVEANPGSKDAEVADCYVTDRHLRIELREPLQIPLYMIEDCHVSTPLPSFGAGMADLSHSTVTLRYRDESGHSRKVQFAMQTSDAGSLQSALHHSYPRGITR